MNYFSQQLNAILNKNKTQQKRAKSQSKIRSQSETKKILLLPQADNKQFIFRPKASNPLNQNHSSIQDILIRHSKYIPPSSSKVYKFNLLRSKTPHRKIPLTDLSLQANSYDKIVKEVERIEMKGSDSVLRKEVKLLVQDIRKNELEQKRILKQKRRIDLANRKFIPFNWQHEALKNIINQNKKSLGYLNRSMDAYKKEVAYKTIDVKNIYKEPKRNCFYL